MCKKLVKASKSGRSVFFNIIFARKVLSVFKIQYLKGQLLNTSLNSFRSLSRTRVMFGCKGYLSINNLAASALSLTLLCWQISVLTESTLHSSNAWASSMYTKMKRTESEYFSAYWLIRRCKDLTGGQE